MRTKSKTAALFVAVVLLGAMAGCGSTNDDKVIGFFVTTQPIQISSERLNHVDPATEITYDDRVYASWQIDANKEPDGWGTWHEYVFRGLEGIRSWTASYPATEEREGYALSTQDPGIHFGHTDGTAHNAAIGVCSSTDVELFFYTVYQSEELSVYLVGPGTHYTVPGGTPPSDEMHVETVATDTGQYTLGVDVVVATQTVVIIATDEAGGELNRQQYEADALPKSIYPLQRTAKLVVEFQADDQTVTRQNYTETDPAIKIFSPDQAGVCVSHLTSIEWG